MPSTTREQRGFVKSNHHSHRQKERGKASGKPRSSSRNGADSDTVRSEGSILASILQCRPIPSNSGFASQFNDIVEHVSSGYSSDETSSSYDSEYSSDDDDDGSSCSSGYSSDSSLELEVVSRGRSARSKKGVNSNRHRSDRRSRRSPPPSSHYRRSIQKRKKDVRSEEKSSSAKNVNPIERADAKKKKKKVPSPAKAKPATQTTTTKPKKADDETADKTRKRGNRRSDKKSQYAESALRDARIPSYIKEEEEEDLKSDEENRNHSPSQPKRLGRECEPFSSQNASGLANNSIKHGQQSFDKRAISHGTTKSTSLSSASSGSSATSFSLNTNFNYSNAAGRNIQDHEEGQDDSSYSSNSHSSSSSTSETEFSLNTMQTPHRSPVETGDDFVDLCVPQGDLHVELENSTHGPIISAISAKTVAPALRVGDVIVALDGVNVERFPPQSVLELLNARRSQPVRILKIKQGSAAMGFHAILQARAQTKLKEDTKAALDDIEKMNISRGSDNMPGSKSNSFCNENGGGVQSARKELKIETAASPTDADEVSLFTTVPPGMYQI